MLFCRHTEESRCATWFTHWRTGVSLLLLFGLLAVGVLWSCLLLDYGTTRYIYFVVALLHVLAEVPFLLRMI
jgi:hypothetical protein